MAKAKFTQRKDGRWCTNVWDGTYVNGKKHRVTLYSNKSSRDLEAKVNEFLSNVKENKNIIKSNISVYEYALKWLDMKKVALEAKTIINYKTHLNKIKYFENIKFSELNRIMIQDFANSMSEFPYTASQALTILKSICLSAKRDRLLSADVLDDLFFGIALPKPVKTQRRPLYPEEIDCLLSADLNESDRVLILLLYGCGLRCEEVLALKASDITEKGVVINKALSLSETPTRLKPPKSKNGYRTVPIPDGIRDEVEMYAAEKDLLFPNKKGQYISRDIYRTRWKNIIKKVMEVSRYKYDDLPDDFGNFTTHYLRHNYCTSLCYESALNHTISTKKIAEMLGDTEDMVIKVYSHIISDLENQQDAVNNCFKI